MTAEPSSEAAAADRAVFRLATEDVRVIIGKYIPPTDGDTPEHRALSLGRFLARCRDNAPNAAVVVILPNANAPNIDAAALDAALRTYFAVSRENAEARQ